MPKFPANGEVIAFKTDTVWGFGCNPEDIEAVSKIYEIKKRDLKKPLILMSSDFKYLEKYIKNVPPYAFDLIKKYLPGGLTLIFEKSALCPDIISCSNPTIGIRIPNSPDFFKIIEKSNCKVLATTSCNISGEKPVEDYLQALKFKDVATIVPPIEDTKNKNIPSTVILCEEKSYKILRQGAINLL